MSDPIIAPGSSGVLAYDDTSGNGYLTYPYCHVISWIVYSGGDTNGNDHLDEMVGGLGAPNGWGVSGIGAGGCTVSPPLAAAGGIFHVVIMAYSSTDPSCGGPVLPPPGGILTSEFRGEAEFLVGTASSASSGVSSSGVSGSGSSGSSASSGSGSGSSGSSSGGSSGGSGSGSSGGSSGGSSSGSSISSGSSGSGSGGSSGTSSMTSGSSGSNGSSGSSHGGGNGCTYEVDLAVTAPSNCVREIDLSWHEVATGSQSDGSSCPLDMSWNVFRSIDGGAFLEVAASVLLPYYADTDSGLPFGVAIGYYVQGVQTGAISNTGTATIVCGSSSGSETSSGGCGCAEWSTSSQTSSVWSGGACTGATWTGRDCCCGGSATGV